MTAKEAIDRVMAATLYLEISGKSLPKDIREALDMAIAALEATIKPNLPLDYDGVISLEENDAVWRVDADWSPPLIETFTAKNIRYSIQSQQELSKLTKLNLMFFAAKPTPADIEAARKEQT